LIGETEPVKVVFSTENTYRSRPMPINKLYLTWFQRIQELRPGQRITQVRNFVWLMMGVYQSRSVCLSRIAGKIPGPAKLLSITRRLSRLLANPAIRVPEWYEPIAREWLKTQFRNLGEIHFMVDGTKIGFGHQLLIVCLAYRKRAIPIRLDLDQACQGTQHSQPAVGFVGLCSQADPPKSTRFSGR
jgi:hypothetical protein